LLRTVCRRRTFVGLRLLQLDGFAVEESPLGDHQRIGLDLARDPARGRDLHTPGRHHVPFVLPVDDGVHGLHVGTHGSPLADDESLAHLQLAGDLALDVNRVGDIERSLEFGVTADNGEEGGWRTVVQVLGRCIFLVCVLEHHSLLLGQFRTSSLRIPPSTSAQPTFTDS
jgi:hypothetical protein